MYLFLAVLSLHCCTQAFSSCSKCGLLSSCEAIDLDPYYLWRVSLPPDISLHEPMLLLDQPLCFLFQLKDALQQQPSGKFEKKAYYSQYWRVHSMPKRAQSKAERSKFCLYWKGEVG